MVCGDLGQGEHSILCAGVVFKAQELQTQTDPNSRRELEEVFVLDRIKQKKKKINKNFLY